MSGIRPIEYNVLIDQDEAGETTGGGLYKPQEVQEREKHAQVRGRIVDVSPMAFAFDDWPDSEAKPKAGDYVAFAKHAGVFAKGNDGKDYRIVKDKDVVAVIEEATQ